jgi:hypothetical protein
MGGGLCKSKNSIQSKRRESLNIHLSPKDKTFTRIKDNISSKMLMTRKESDKPQFITSSNYSKTTLGKK